MVCLSFVVGGRPSLSMAAWLLLLALTGCAALAALGVTVRGGWSGRAEGFVVGTALFFALIAAPVMALGYTDLLYPGTLAGASFATSAAVFLASARGRGLSAHAREIARTAAAFGKLPWDGLRLAVRARSFATLGLAGAAVAIAGSLVLTHLAPSESWDGFFYHEPMVGFAIQNHGFSMVDLPPSVVVQQANGFPRLCQSVALFFCIFTDKTFIEVANTLAAPGLLLATYALVRRYCSDPVPCLGWSAALLLVPAIYSQLRTTLVDVQVGFFLVAAIHFATRPALRFEDALAGTLCLALLVGSKGTALVWAPPLVLVLYTRLWLSAGKERRRAALALVAGGAAALAGVASLTLVRNHRAFGNPLWPVGYEIPSLGISWRGLISMDTMGAVMPARALVAQKYHHPTGGVGDILARDYGYGVPWVVAPLAAVAALVIVFRALRGRLQRAPAPLAENALLVAGLGVLFLLLPPGPTVARYNIELVAIAMACVAYLAGSRKEATRFHEGAVACTLILSVVPWVWTGFLGGLEMDAGDIARLFRHPAEERASMNFASFQMPPATARRREEELGRGDLTVFTQDEIFIGVLWNHRFDNRVEYVAFQSAPSFLARLDERCAEWVIVGRQSGGRAALETRASSFQQVGVAVQQRGTLAYRRVGACPR
jgi:hypothetical protein